MLNFFQIVSVQRLKKRRHHSRVPVSTKLNGFKLEENDDLGVNWFDRGDFSLVTSTKHPVILVNITAKWYRIEKQNLVCYTNGKIAKERFSMNNWHRKWAKAIILENKQKKSNLMAGQKLLGWIPKKCVEMIPKNIDCAAEQLLHCSMGEFVRLPLSMGPM